MNEKQLLQKILSAINRRRFAIYLILAFLVGCLVTGLFLTGHRSARAGKLDEGPAVLRW
ncbi:MAG: hypothetical protein LBU88_06285 [Treponema sp.]|nr:hypothetical protein [Treponema sp.]